MRQETNNIFKNIDLPIVLVYAILVLFGWVNIYATSVSEEHITILDFSTRYGKQFVWVLLSIPLIIFILFFNSKFYNQFSGVLYLISLLFLAGLFLFGKHINGATSWYNFGAFSIQPSEFSKVFTALALAKLMNSRNYNLKLKKNQIKALLVIFLPAILIALQPDMGSVLVYFAFLLVLHREGLPLVYISLGAIAVPVFILIVFFGVKWILISTTTLLTVIFAYISYKNIRFFRFNFLKFIIIYIVNISFIFACDYTYNNIFSNHQKNRFDILLGKIKDDSGAGYNSKQSELTISSGGLFGKGFLQGNRTQGNFVPEQHTDYIFSTVGEEWGFLGSSFLIIMFMILMFRIIYLSEKQISKFTRIYGYGVVSILFFHLTVNVGMVIGLLPTIGIPLPFFSYGGSSLWSFTILIFIFIRLDAHKKYDW